MSALEDLVIRRATEDDVEAIALFMHTQGQAQVTAEYLRHWYFRSPVSGGAVLLGERDGTIQGMATMTAHRFRRKGIERIVAMPQKVLTDEKARGQGIFGKLYRASERTCQEDGADFFLTVTNAASTPMFLGKFGYVRATSPRMTVLSPLPGKVEAFPLQKEGHARLQMVEADHWRMVKDKAHDEWRFLDHPMKGHMMVDCSRGSETLGGLFLKRIHKKGVPVLLLLDMAPAHERHAPALLRVARKLAWKHRCVALLALEEGAMAKAIAANGPALRMRSGLNLLVKGQDPGYSEVLAHEGFEMAFGDLDFF